MCLLIVRYDPHIANVLDGWPSRGAALSYVAPHGSASYRVGYRWPKGWRIGDALYSCG